MEIVVVGSGAMGAVMGALLHKAGNAVTLVDLRSDHMARIARDGLTIHHGDGAEELIRVSATADPSTVTTADVVFVMTKTWATTEAVDSVSHAIGPATWVVSAQNGLGNEERMSAATDPTRVMAGTTTVGATYVEAGVVSVPATVTQGSSLTQFGLPSGLEQVPDDAEAVAEAFTAAGLRAEILPDADQVVWTKLCMAGTAGCLTALAQITIGDMVESADAMRTWRVMFDEILAVGAAEGVALDGNQVAEHALTTYRTVGRHWASMAVDVRERRRTEIDAMCGEISRRGRRHGMATPVNDAIGDMILAVERSWVASA